ncbi:hypothetical protein [Mixta gaviniae]|uniref:Uncharacterized protein n=1 Tax=Mixta gaviniae TaxID=665914 RepID=A0A1X1DLG1_9GAMM|nr:hypothetical protein [Mixta gaviniae]AUX93486.1 hypothetical protein C2E15_10620 [Mixta gaviniae]ORM77457.1 hypothetical protein HA44_14120 [Mixta gaviniae]
MWFVLSEVEKITRKSRAQLENAMRSGRLAWRMSERGQVEIELSSVLSAFVGEQAGAVSADEASRRLEQQWEWLWHPRVAR